MSKTRGADERWGWMWIGLLLAVLIGLVPRLYDLGGVSLSDDEAFKVNAVEAYRRGHWLVSHDDEHPLGMKLLIYASYAARDAWNAHASEGAKITIEAATRAPNAIVGALIALVIALLGRDLYSRRVGLAAALLWAVEPNSIGFSRVAKEDTLLTLFLLACFHFAIRARRAADSQDAIATKRNEHAAAAMLGLAFACKYFFHLAFVLPLYYGWSRLSGSAWRLSARRWAALVGIAFVVFLAFNPTVLHPANLRYIVGYLTSKTLHAHAYLFMGRLYMNQALEGGHPTPWYFYFVFLAVKASIPLLVTLALGIAVCARRGGDGARLFASLSLIWIVVHAFVSGGKFTRYVMPMMPVVCLLAALGADAAASWIAERIAKARSAALAPALQILAIATVLLPTGAAALEVAPHYRMVLNAFGGAPEKLRWWFPHCDFYDVGLREAVEWVCERAPAAGAQLRADPNVAAAYYAAQCRRAPIEVTGLAETDPPCRPGRACYQILQVGRTDFGTLALFESLHASRAPDAVVRVRGVEVAEVYAPQESANAGSSSMLAGAAVASERRVAPDTVIVERSSIAAR